MKFSLAVLALLPATALVSAAPVANKPHGPPPPPSHISNVNADGNLSGNAVGKGAKAESWNGNEDGNIVANGKPVGSISNVNVDGNGSGNAIGKHATAASTNGNEDGNISLMKRGKPKKKVPPPPPGKISNVNADGNLSGNAVGWGAESDSVNGNGDGNIKAHGKPVGSISNTNIDGNGSGNAIGSGAYAGSTNGNGDGNIELAKRGKSKPKKKPPPPPGKISNVNADGNLSGNAVGWGAESDSVNGNNDGNIVAHGKPVGSISNVNVDGNGSGNAIGSGAYAGSTNGNSDGNISLRERSVKKPKQQSS